MVLFALLLNDSRFDTTIPHPYLHLLKRDLKAEGLVVVRIQSVLFHRCLLLLQPLPILQQVNFHIWI